MFFPCPVLDGLEASLEREAGGKLCSWLPVFDRMGAGDVGEDGKKICSFPELVLIGFPRHVLITSRAPHHHMQKVDVYTMFDITSFLMLLLF